MMCVLCNLSCTSNTFVCHSCRLKESAETKEMLSEKDVEYLVRYWIADIQRKSKLTNDDVF